MTIYCNTVDGNSDVSQVLAVSPKLIKGLSGLERPGLDKYIYGGAPSGPIQLSVLVISRARMF